MLAKLYTFSLLGIEAVPVEVEVDVSPGAIPKTILVGLPEAAVRESTYRVERAIVNCGFQRPYDRVVVNLAPAELPKQAASFDLPITLGVLAGSGQLTSDRFEQYAVVGELSLEGRTWPAKARCPWPCRPRGKMGSAESSCPTRMPPKRRWSSNWR
jgi:magnesium chelatase family protein